MNYPIHIRGAYGRTYQTREQIIADWNANKDFMIIAGSDSGRYISKETFAEYGNPLDYVLFQCNTIAVTFWHPKYARSA